MKKTKTTSLTTRYVLAVGALLLVTNILLGAVLIRQTTSSVRALIRKNMLDLVNTAAGLLDGDELGALTEEDVGREPYNKVLNQLAVFQNNIDIEFIYAVRQVGEDEFVFTVDPDPVNPGEFGSPVVVTDALRQAGRGVAMVDNEPAQDAWGCFYSAYSPVFDSEGKVAGIVGVDFSSEWYDRQMRENTLSMGALSLLFVMTGGAVVLMITRKLSQRFNALSDDLGVLSTEMDELMELIPANGERTEEPEPEVGSEDGDQRVTDELEALRAKIQSMQDEMQRYLIFVHAQAYTDALTRVGNTTAYMELRQRLEEQIASKACAFGLAVFDINLLKLVNDRYGHIAGDHIIQGAASVISSVFGTAQTYRIGGDEFVALATDCSEAEMAAWLEQVEEQVRGFNSHQEHNLSLSMGASVYRPDEDGCFQTVFARADQTMYRQKEAYHRGLEGTYERYE